MGVQRAGDSGSGTILQRGVAYRHQVRAELSHGAAHQHRARHCRAAAVRAPDSFLASQIIVLCKVSKNGMGLAHEHNDQIAAQLAGLRWWALQVSLGDVGILKALFWILDSITATAWLHECVACVADVLQC